ncbi:hypothetical protein [Congregibacter sp.]|uniref:hypothetical protein n=1 Tax=Congregibacter sp. TaxID=2744308 RepID=UPI003F6BE58A
MKKTDKKTERALSAALTRICDSALKAIPGFVWITHFVNYKDFPNSLVIVSVFGTDDELREVCGAQLDLRLSASIQEELKMLDAPINVKAHQIRCDTEEACERDNNGNWQERYRYSQLH